MLSSSRRCTRGVTLVGRRPDRRDAVAIGGENFGGVVVEPTVDDNHVKRGAVVR